jgi:ornithine--oxo-acid transaminase
MILGALLTTFTKKNNPKFSPGPYLPGLPMCPYNDLAAMEKCIMKEGPENVVGIVLEPIQGEAGIVIPDNEYPKIPNR